MLNGARVPGVDEPHLSIPSTLETTSFRSQVLIQVEFDEIAEPKGLSSAELLQLVKKFGSSYKVADAIGVSEAFVRQNSSPKTKRRRSHGKAR